MELPHSIKPKNLVENNKNDFFIKKIAEFNYSKAIVPAPNNYSIINLNKIKNNS